MKIFVTGTSTDVGKTYISAGLAWQINHHRKKKFTYIKPFATGVSENFNSDVEFVKKTISSFHQSETQGWFAYQEPASPFIAAQAEKKRVPYHEILEKIKLIEKDSSDYLMEGAGGIYVPITSDKMVIDLMVEIDWPIIIVAHYGLGTVNHTCLTVEALKNRNCLIAGIILNQIHAPNLNGNDLASKTNQAEIERVSGVEVLGVVKFGDRFDSEVFSNIWHRLSKKI